MASLQERLALLITSIKASFNTLSARVTVAENLFDQTKPSVGYYTCNGKFHNTLTTLIGAINRVDLFPFNPEFTFTSNLAGCLCSTAVAGALGKIVVYSADADGRPANLLLETGTLDFASVGFKSVAAALTFTKGVRYFVGIRHLSTATLNAVPLADSPTLAFATTPTTAPLKLIRRTIAFATPAPAAWNYVDSELVSATPTAIFFRVAS